MHFVVERDGTITQQVPTNRRANHAGQSSWQGRKYCNSFSIGIEIVNPGKMTWAGNDQSIARAWWGEFFQNGAIGVDVVEMATPEHGSGVWMGYPNVQIAAVAMLLEALFAGIPTLRDITTHWYVSPGRKVDTNPLFPLEHIRAKVLGRDDPAEIDAEKRSRASGGFARINSADGLNMRRWPSFNPNVIATIPHGAQVPVLRTGIFEGRDWLCVIYAGQEGWIIKSYTENTVNEGQA